MLAPKRVKFRKTFKGRTKGIATRGNTVAFGEYALMSLEPGWVSNRQIEAAILGGCRDAASVGSTCKAGTNCGSCIPEIMRMCASHRSEAVTVQSLPHEVRCLESMQ